MKPKDYEIAKELKEKLSKVVRLIDFRVFGSRGEGGYKIICYNTARFA